MVTPLSDCGAARLAAFGGAGAAISGLLVVTNFLGVSALLGEFAFAAETAAGLWDATGFGAALPGAALAAGAFAAPALSAAALTGAGFTPAFSGAAFMPALGGAALMAGLAGRAGAALLAADFATVPPDLPEGTVPEAFFAGAATFACGFAGAFCGARTAAFAAGFARAGAVAVFARLAVFGLLFGIPKPIL